MLVQATHTKKVFEYLYDQSRIIALKSQGYKCIKCKDNTAIYTKGKSFVTVYGGKTRVYIITCKAVYERELQKSLDKLSQYL